MPPCFLTCSKNAQVENRTCKEILQVATGIFGKDWEVSSFLDSDTGLRSRNHFVLKYIEPIVIPEPEEETVKKWYEKFIIK